MIIKSLTVIMWHRIFSIAFTKIKIHSLFFILFSLLLIRSLTISNIKYQISNYTKRKKVLYVIYSLSLAARINLMIAANTEDRFHWSKIRKVGIALMTIGPI